MKQAYISRKFTPAVLDLIEVMNGVVQEYQKQGFVLTARQLYYQMVARGYSPNTVQDYKRIASTINDAKLAGLIDWDALEDRTREFVRRTRWGSGAEIMRGAAEGFHMDMWVGQPHRVFVIVEKEALVGVLDRVCREFDVPLLAARGYPSGSVLREFALSDLLPAMEGEQTPIVLHLGDHDPSGIDMTRDLYDRMELFCNGQPFDMRRIALNMEQVREVNPPENPAKTTDSRYAGYIRKFGQSSWELDALSPTYLDRLVRAQLKGIIDKEPWEEATFRIESTKKRIRELAIGFE